MNHGANIKSAGTKQIPDIISFFFQISVTTVAHGGDIWGGALFIQALHHAGLGTMGGS